MKRKNLDQANPKKKTINEKGNIVQRDIDHKNQTNQIENNKKQRES